MKIRYKYLLHWLLVLMMILMHGAVLWSIYCAESYIAIGILLSFIIWYSVKFHMNMPKWFILYFVVTASCYVISALINGIGFNTGLNIKTALTIDMYLILVWYTYNSDHKKTVTSYIDLITILAFISLVFFTAQSLLGKDVIRQWFKYFDWGRGHYVNLIYTFPLIDIRNYGIFYEPGVYQIVLMSALYLVTYASDYYTVSNRKKIISMIILVVTILTSGSTTGYISLAFITLGILSQRIKTKAQKQIIALFLVGLIAVAINFIFKGNDSIVSVFVLNKIDEMKGSSIATNYNSSGGARLFMISLALNALKENPFFGIGADRVNAAIAAQFWQGFGPGNGLFGMIASQGLVTVIITHWPLFHYAYKNKNSAFQYWLFCLLYFNTTIAQSSYAIACPAFLLMALIRLKSNNKNLSVNTHNERQQMVFLSRI